MEIENLKYYIISDKKITYYFDNEIIENNFDTLNNFFDNWINFFQTYYKQLATIGGSDSLVYVANVGNIATVENNNLEIKITFKNGTELNIYNLTVTDSIYNYQYISDVLRAWNIDTEILTRNKIFVSVNNAEDVTAGIYNDINRAFNNANYGDIIIVEEGSYNINTINLRNGIDFYFKENTYVTNLNGDIFTDANDNIYSRIYGSGNFNANGIALFLDNESNVFFEFNTIYAKVAGVYCHNSGAENPLGCVLRIKGYLIQSEGHCLDSDGVVKCYDADICINESLSGGCNYYPSDTTVSNVYLRNSFMKALRPEFSNIYLDHSSGVGYNFNAVNLRIYCGNERSNIDFPIFQSPSVNLWNCYLQTVGINTITAFDPQVTTCYGVNYGNVVAADNIYFDGSGNFIIESNLNLTK